MCFRKVVPLQKCAKIKNCNFLLKSYFEQENCLGTGGKNIVSENIRFMKANAIY